MVIITGTCISSVVELSVASFPFLAGCPKLNWKVGSVACKGVAEGKT